MDVRVLMQGLPGSPTLLELLESAAADATSLTAGIAFVSQSGVDAFFGLDPVARLALEGSVKLLVGMDAVTDRNALEALQERESVFPGVRVLVFRNPGIDLFHPKVFHFVKADGAIESICGSGNLTRGGLQKNFEGLTILRLNSTEAAEADFSWLNAFQELEASCEPISEEILEEAARNARVRGRAGTQVRPVEAETEEATSAEDSTLFLIGFVPKAGGRWTQLHLNNAVLPRFFDIPAVSGEPILLTHVRTDGTREPTESRQVVLSDTNQNVKIELGAGHGRQYQSRPIVIFKRVEARRFQYMLLMPGDAGHDPLSTLLGRATDSIGRGLTRVIRKTTHLQTAWPACPLL